MKSNDELYRERIKKTTFNQGAVSVGGVFLLIGAILHFFMLVFASDHGLESPMYYLGLVGSVFMVIFIILKLKEHIEVALFTDRIEVVNYLGSSAIRKEQIEIIIEEQSKHNGALCTVLIQEKDGRRTHLQLKSPLNFMAAVKKYRGRQFVETSTQELGDCP